MFCSYLDCICIIAIIFILSYVACAFVICLLKYLLTYLLTVAFRIRQNAFPAMVPPVPRCASSRCSQTAILGWEGTPFPHLTQLSALAARRIDFVRDCPQIKFNNKMWTGFPTKMFGSTCRRPCIDVWKLNGPMICDTVKISIHTNLRWGSNVWLISVALTNMSSTDLIKYDYS